MSESTTPKVPAGWYPDPAGSPRSRWWDGTQWTENFQEPYSREAAAIALQAPEGAKVYNPWIWAVVFLPYVTLPFIFAIDYSSMYSGALDTDPYASSRAQLELMTSPGYVLLSLGGFAAWVLGVLAAFSDSRWLTTQGIQRPFHWAWNFIGYPVYAIGRSVVVKRRTGRGSAVMWAAIGMLVVSFFVIIAFTVMLTTEMMRQMAPLVGY